jgi:hypothetical protein
MMVKIDGRAFIVTFADNGEPMSIKERKLWMPGTYMERFINSPYWHHSHKVGGASSMPARILAAARGAS